MSQLGFCPLGPGQPHDRLWHPLLHALDRDGGTGALERLGPWLPASAWRKASISIDRAGGSYLIPRAAAAFAQGNAAELLRRMLARGRRVYAGVLGAFALVVLATGDFSRLDLRNQIRRLRASGRWAPGVLALGMVALSLGLTAGVGLWAINRPKANLTADFCARRSPSC